MPFLGSFHMISDRDDFVIVCSFNHLVIDVEKWLKLANVSREKKTRGKPSCLSVTNKKVQITK